MICAKVHAMVTTAWMILSHCTRSLLMAYGLIERKWQNEQFRKCSCDTIQTNFSLEYALPGDRSLGGEAWLNSASRGYATMYSTQAN